MFGLGAQELVIILAIAFFIFGAKRLPELGKGLGQGIRGFKKGLEEKPQVDDPAGRGVNRIENNPGE